MGLPDILEMKMLTMRMENKRNKNKMGNPLVKDAFTLLSEGNQRHFMGTSLKPNQDPERIREVSTGQYPFAAVLTCADSQVTPEILFDCGLGDLYVVRVAGNILNDMNLGSLEYAVDYLGVSLIVVLGHQKCGTIHAAMEDENLPGYLPSLVEGLTPAVKAANKKSLEAVTRMHVRLTCEDIKHMSESIYKHVYDGSVKVVSGFYHLDTGQVEWLD